MSFQKSGTLSYAIVLVGQLLVVLSMVEFSWCSNCRISLGSDSRIQTAYSTITLKRSSLNQLQTIVTPECLQTNSSPHYDTFAMLRTVNLTFTIKYGSNVDCANSYLFISGDVTGTGLVTIYEGLTKELSTQHHSLI
ncbi:hypothetical protein EB796_005234 [Bugula neritina]|uniref:Uncharacterized protein n=1 Tax=Bugula neritina TaxID=10212 RepID=A0A7J7KG43_BUGNE|nr:hypothetical protein EB796_005234 [Bugula neritina]